jgi:catechol 2,3-dioxygenase-like lactoylglutathione lyase family enzyme
VLLDISHIDQIGFGVADIDRAEDFYGRALGPRKLLRVGDLTFFECGGIRLLLEKCRGPGAPVHGGMIYLRCADIALAFEELRARYPASGLISIIGVSAKIRSWHKGNSRKSWLKVGLLG